MWPALFLTSNHSHIRQLQFATQAFSQKVLQQAVQISICQWVCGVTDQRFHNSREMFEFYATKSCLFLLKAMYVMGNLSDIMDLLILWRLDALFGCGRANSEVDAWSGER